MLLYYFRPNAAEPTPTATSTLQTTNRGHKRDGKTKPGLTGQKKLTADRSTKISINARPLG